MPYEEISEYITQLNSIEFEGYDDWRLPTVDEVKSLLTSEKMNDGLYLDPRFDREKFCWTSDVDLPDKAWFVDFQEGLICLQYMVISSGCVRAVRSIQWCESELKEFYKYLRILIISKRRKDAKYAGENPSLFTY